MKHDMDFWARQVKDRSEVPESFAVFFESVTARTEEFPYTVFAPPDRWYRLKTTPKLLVMLEDRIWIAEKHKKQIETTCFLFQDINYIETGALLLQSWLEISGIVKGQITTVKVEFNTVVDGLFKPITEKIRSTIHHLGLRDLANGQHKNELSKFDVLMRTNYKYMNFCKRSLLPGEQVHCFIFQPDIRVPFLQFFQRILAVTHLALVTDHELIMIMDDDSLKTVQQVRYGGIWRYIPISKLAEMKIAEIPEQDTVKLSALLPGGAAVSSLFSLSKRPELEGLIRRIDGSGLAQKECV